MKKGMHKVLHIFQERVFMIFSGIILLFLVIALKFYQLQIIEYDTFASGLRASVERTIEIPATRGLIFDRYGRPLAINQATRVLKIDQQVQMTAKDTNKQFNDILLKVIKLLEQNGDTYIDNVPISQKAPFEYTASENAVKQFTYSIPYNDEDHRQELISYTANQMIAYLRSKKCFNIDESYTDEEARKLIAIRAEVYKIAGYRKYKLVTIAKNISEKTVAQIEEKHEEFLSVSVDVESSRYYPEGSIMGNILGYTRTITDTQYQSMKEEGYDKDDIVGHEGIEKSMESQLRGEKGMERVEVDDMGRRVHTIQQDDAKQGNNVFLTIDLDLQKVAYDSIEKNLSQALIERLRGMNRDIKTITGHEFVVSMVESSQLVVEDMGTAPQGTKQQEMYAVLMQYYNALDELIKQDMTLKKLFIQLIEEEEPVFTDKEILLAIHEQGRLKLSNETVNQIKKDKYGNVEYILIDQLEKAYLKPSQTAIDPFSAASVAIDVKTGEVLALVGYPTFNSNEMITNFNSYYSSLMDNIDQRNMLWNRALMTPQAPGSTFKMIAGIAGLEEGVITPSTTFYDTGTFTKAGKPYPKCWVFSRSGGGHGIVDIYRALEVSCNYFFYEVAYKLGFNHNQPYSSINILTNYAQMFGLHEKTGIELPEATPNVSNPTNLIRRQMTSIFSSLRTMNDEKRAKYVQEVKKLMQNSGQKGIYPYGDEYLTDIESRVETAVQYELKRNLEPLLQDATEDSLEEIINEAYQDIQESLEIQMTEVLDSIVNHTINDTSSRSLKSKTKGQLKKSFDYMLKDSVNVLIANSVEKIDGNDILDAYDHAYTTIYNKELKKGTDQLLIETLRTKIEQLDSQEAYYKAYVATKVRENLIETIIDNLLEGISLEWTDGFTVRTAIGQGDNAFTPLQLGRYIAGLANGKEVFDLRIVNGIYNNKQTNTYQATSPIKYNDLTISQNTLDVIYQGMKRVVNGNEGSARKVFSEFEIPIAAKTGTAQGIGTHEHSWFVAFAPYDDPQIAIVTTIYNADGLGTYGTLITKDILSQYFMLGKKNNLVTLDNMFID